MDIIKQLKKNKYPFGLMTEAMQAKAKEIGHVKFKVFCSDIDWKFRGPDDKFGECFTYRLRPDYQEKPSVVECEINGGSYIWKHPNGKEELRPLSGAIDDRNFLGFRFKEGMLRVDPIAYMPKDNYEGIHHRCEINGLKNKDIVVIKATAVFFEVKPTQQDIDNIISEVNGESNER